MSDPCSKPYARHPNGFPVSTGVMRSLMSEMKDPKKSSKSSAPIFVPKQEQEGVVELTLDEALLKFAELYRQFAPLKAQMENLKTITKEMVKKTGEKSYTHTPTGIKAQFIVSQKSKINKELAKELCGARWAEVESFVAETSFKVTVPGVKSPDAD